MAVLLLVFLLKRLHCSHFLSAGAVQYGICILVLAFSLDSVFSLLVYEWLYHMGLVALDYVFL